MYLLAKPPGTLSALGNIRNLLGLPDHDYSGVPAAFIAPSFVVTGWNPGTGAVTAEPPGTSRAAAGPGRP